MSIFAAGLCGYDGLSKKMESGVQDKNGKDITAGSIIRNPDGFIGKVVFANCAWRVDVSANYTGAYLLFNSSLLFCDRWKPWEFEVL